MGVGRKFSLYISVSLMELASLCENLKKHAGQLVSSEQWPDQQLRWCAEAGVFKWFISNEYDGIELPYEKTVAGYVRLASVCLTTTFVITQRTGACKRILASENEGLKRDLLPPLARGDIFATVGLSHLTTSHRHVGEPVLSARRDSSGQWILDGFSPWVTGGAQADIIVAGAETEEHEHVFFAVPTSMEGVVCEPGFGLTALAASQTGRVNFNQVRLHVEHLVSAPRRPGESKGSTQNTGGLQTSALAIGLASAAVAFVTEQAKFRENLSANALALRSELNELEENLLSLARGDEVCSNEAIRSSANSFVLRATQSALIAAKGAGFVEGHDVGRWCREALFFLVWSCPQNVSDNNLCEFAGIA